MAENGELFDYIYEIKDVSRYRVNFCRDIFHGKLTFRTIPYHIKTIDELGLPSHLGGKYFLIL